MKNSSRKHDDISFVMIAAGLYIMFSRETVCEFDPGSLPTNLQAFWRKKMSSLYVLYDNPELNLRARSSQQLYQTISRMVDAFKLWNSVRIARCEMKMLPDYLLEDIGIERHMIDEVVGAPRHR